MIVEPVDPGQGGPLNVFHPVPRAIFVDDLDLVQSVNRFCQGIVVGISYRSDGSLKARLCQPF